MEGRHRNPLQGFMDHVSEMNRAREHWMTGYDSEERRRTHATAWVPTVDIYAEQSDLVIRCELAGVRQEDVEITLSNGVLTISGERRDRPENVHYYVHERFYGRFRRNMTLPEGVAEGDVSASFEDGMLQITVKGAAAASEPSKIEIG